MTARRIPLADRFAEKVSERGPEDCWPWVGAIHVTGYGVIRRDTPSTKVEYAHRVALELAGRPAPDDLDVDHLCRNRSCVNPDHLEAVSHRENCLRGESPTILLYLSGRCLHGHAMTHENTYAEPRFGRRTCRECRRDRDRARRERLKRANP